MCYVHVFSLISVEEILPRLVPSKRTLPHSRTPLNKDVRSGVPKTLMRLKLTWRAGLATRTPAAVLCLLRARFRPQRAWNMKSAWFTQQNVPCKQHRTNLGQRKGKTYNPSPDNCVDKVRDGPGSAAVSGRVPLGSLRCARCRGDIPKAILACPRPSALVLQPHRCHLELAIVRVFCHLHALRRLMKVARLRIEDTKRRRRRQGQGHDAFDACFRREGEAGQPSN